MPDRPDKPDQFIYYDSKQLHPRAGRDVCSKDNARLLADLLITLRLHVEGNFGCFTKRLANTTVLDGGTF